MLSSWALRRDNLLSRRPTSSRTFAMENRMKDSAPTTLFKRRVFGEQARSEPAAATADQEAPLARAQPLGLPIGLELFTLRLECSRDFPGTLEKVAAIGYKEVELFDFYGRKPSEIRRILSSAGLVAPSSHTLAYVLRPQYSHSEVTSRWAKLIEYAAELGVRYLGGSVAGVSNAQPSR